MTVVNFVVVNFGDVIFFDLVGVNIVGVEFVAVELDFPFDSSSVENSSTSILKSMSSSLVLVESSMSLTREVLSSFVMASSISLFFDGTFSCELLGLYT